MGHSLKATTNSMRQSEPQAIPALREERAGGGGAFAGKLNYSNPQL